MGEDHVAAATKLIQKHLTDKAGLIEFRSLHVGHADALKRILAELPPQATTKITKRLDPHNPQSKSMGKAAALAHIEALAGGAVEPAPVPVRAPRSASAAKSSAPAIPFADLVSLSDAGQRTAGLNKLAVAALKAGIRDQAMHPEGVPKAGGKKELIAHIEKVIRMGWPGPLDVMALNRK